MENSTTNYPGINASTFFLQFDKDCFNKGDIINQGSTEVVVTKVYKNTWWRKLLRSLGFSVRIFQCKVKPVVRHDVSAKPAKPNEPSVGN